MLVPRITIESYCNNTELPFYDTNSILAPLVPQILNTDQFQAVLTDIMKAMYGDYYLRDKYSLEISKIKNDVMAWYAANAYKYQGLYNSTQYQYEPLENYRMVEEGTDKINGAATDINSYGERKIIDNEGERTDTSNIGTKTTNNTFPQYSDSQTLQVSPMDTSSYANKEKTDIQHGMHTDKVEEGAQENKYVKGSIESTTTENEREDVLEKEHNSTTEHKLTRSGNIGVTTSQQMLASEREIVDYSLFLQIAKELMKLLCIRVSMENKYIVVND